jgi:hypothetical protein
MSISLHFGLQGRRASDVRRLAIMRTPTYFSVFVFGALLLGCATQQKRLPYHFSGDFQSQVLYLSSSVAIAKHLSVYPDVDTKTFYALGRAHREDAELATDTGDRFDESVKGNLKRVGTSSDGHWLLVESDDYDQTAQKTVVHLTAVALPSGQMYSAVDISALRKLVAVDFGSARLEPVELFFDRSLILRFHDPLD